MIMFVRSVCSKVKKKPACGAGLGSVLQKLKRMLRFYLFDGRAGSLWEGQRHHRPRAARARGEISQIISTTKLPVRRKPVNGGKGARVGSGWPVHKPGEAALTWDACSLTLGAT
jgi:hypothetical protein